MPCHQWNDSGIWTNYQGAKKVWLLSVYCLLFEGNIFIYNEFGAKYFYHRRLLFFIFCSYQPSPFFVLDEVDAALDNANVKRVVSYIRRHANASFQFIVISFKNILYERAEGLVGIYRDIEHNSSKSLTLKVNIYKYI